jgi:hypothetical protein
MYGGVLLFNLSSSSSIGQAGGFVINSVCGNAVAGDLLRLGHEPSGDFFVPGRHVSEGSTVLSEMFIYVALLTAVVHGALWLFQCRNHVDEAFIIEARARAASSAAVRTDAP